MQEGILFHTVTADRPVYLVQVTCELHGALDTTAFHRAWQAVVDQHAACARCSCGPVTTRRASTPRTPPP